MDDGGNHAHRSDLSDHPGSAAVKTEGLPGRALPDGYYLVHNQVTPQRPLGKNGFRAWVQDNADGLAECGCDFGKNKNAKVNRHYRVRSISP